MDYIHNWQEWIGTDESGKGDYFGPLIVAGVYINVECRDEFIEMGITDGKKITNSKIRKLAEWMWSNYEQNIIVLKKMPVCYNSLYENLRKQGKNLNTMLAQLHVEVIQKLIMRFKVNNVIVDKFSYHDIITPMLSHREMVVKQITSGERDIAVAAASVIARNSFLTGIETLSEKYNMNLPRGAYKVIDAGKEFVQKHGPSELKSVAKLHFKTTKPILG